MKLPPNLANAVLGAAALLYGSATFAGPTGNPFYGDPPDENHPWAIHDQNRPQPKLVTPGAQPGQAPSDAVVLFDGTDATLANWESDSREGGPTKWVVKDGAMECVPKSGYVRTKQQLGDCQLHVEWAAPTKAEGESQGRGNSGVFLMGLVEIQVLDNYNNPTYADGFAASVYGVNPPAANALRPPGEFNSYDIIFRKPVYEGNKLIDPGYVTVFQNGVLVQDQTPLEGGTGHMKRSKTRPFPEKGPLKLQDHGNPVRFRNIWYRELPKRTIGGATDNALPPERALAKRKEIAAGIREDAAKLPDKSIAQLLRLAESLVYEQNEPTLQKVTQLATEYAAVVKAMPADKAAAQKNEVKRVQAAFAYLTKFKLVPDTFAPKSEIDAIVKANKWDEPAR